MEPAEFARWQQATEGMLETANDLAIQIEKDSLTSLTQSPEAMVAVKAFVMEDLDPASELGLVQVYSLGKLARIVGLVRWMHATHLLGQGHRGFLLLPMRAATEEAINLGWVLNGPAISQRPLNAEGRPLPAGSYREEDSRQRLRWLTYHAALNGHKAINGLKAVDKRDDDDYEAWMHGLLCMSQDSKKEVQALYDEIVAHRSDMSPDSTYPELKGLDLCSRAQLAWRPVKSEGEGVGTEIRYATYLYDTAYRRGSAEMHGGISTSRSHVNVTSKNQLQVSPLPRFDHAWRFGITHAYDLLAYALGVYAWTYDWSDYSYVNDTFGYLKWKTKPEWV